MSADISRTNGDNPAEELFQRLRPGMERETNTGNWFRKIRVPLSRLSSAGDQLVLDPLIKEVGSHPTVMAVLLALAVHRDDFRERMLRFLEEEIMAHALPESVSFEFAMERKERLPSAFKLGIDDTRGFVRNKLIACIPHAEGEERRETPPELLKAGETKVSKEDLVACAQTMLHESLAHIAEENRPQLTEAIHSAGREKQEIIDHLRTVSSYYQQGDDEKTLHELLANILDRNHQSDMNVRQAISFFCRVAVQKCVSGFDDDRVRQCLGTSRFASSRQLLVTRMTMNLSHIALYLMDTFNPEECRRSA